MCGLVRDIQFDDVESIESIGLQFLFTLRGQLSFNRTLPFSFGANRSLLSGRREKELQQRGSIDVRPSELRVRIEGSRFAQRNIATLILPRQRVTYHPITRPSCCTSRSAFDRLFIKMFAQDIHVYSFIIADSNTLLFIIPITIEIHTAASFSYLGANQLFIFSVDIEYYSKQRAIHKYHHHQHNRSGSSNYSNHDVYDAPIRQLW